MPRDEAIISISVRGLAQTRRRYSEGEKYAQAQIHAAMTQGSLAGLEILKEAAPERWGALKRELRVGRVRGTGTLTAQIESPVVSESGFAYTVVTRRGRRAVKAKRESMPSKALGKIPGTGGRFRRSASALGLFPDEDGDGIYRRNVKAWRPEVDWVDAARPEVQATMDRAMSEAADNIATFMNRGFRRTVRVGLRG